MKLRVFSLFPFINKKIIVFIFTSVFICIIGCKHENNITTSFKSDFKNKDLNTTVSKLEYWTINPKDWKIESNRIECLVSKKNTQIHLLTRQLTDQKGDLEMKVRLGFFNHKISNLNKNWAGFHIGSKSIVYKNKKGLDIGVCTNGALFIGAPSPNPKNNNIIKALKKGIDLKILISNNTDSYTIDLSVLDPESGKLLSQISKKNITPEQISGDFALISSFENSKIENEQTKKSVWFQDWEIKGTKVAMLNNN